MDRIFVDGFSYGTLMNLYIKGTVSNIHIFFPLENQWITVYDVS